MSPNKSIPTPEAREASTITTEEIPLSGGPYEVGVELEDVSPKAESERTPRAQKAQIDPSGACAPWWGTVNIVAPGPNPRTTVAPCPRMKESPAVNVLRECLETMERDRLEAGARRTKCPTLMERYCLVRLSEFIKSVLLVFINQRVLGVQGVLRSFGLFETITCECLNSRT